MTQTLTTENQFAASIERAISAIDPTLAAELDLQLLRPSCDRDVLAIGFDVDGNEGDFGDLPVVFVSGHDLALGETTFEMPTVADSKVQLELLIDFTDLRDVRIVDNDPFVIAATVRLMLTEDF